jgi:hypothetical protein
MEAATGATDRLVNRIGIQAIDPHFAEKLRTDSPFQQFPSFWRLFKSFIMCKLLILFLPDDLDPIYVKASEVAIQGRVLGVLRKYR